MRKTMLTPQYFIFKAMKSRSPEQFMDASIGLMNYWIRVFDFNSRLFRDRLMN